MENDKTPEQNIQSLFFQALRPLDKNLRPSDIMVTIAPIADAHPYDVERNYSLVTIDLKGTSFARFVRHMESGLPHIGSSKISEDGVITWRADPARITEIPSGVLQRDLAESLLWNPQAEDLVKALKAASKGAQR